jgi:hypothetical protein
MQLGFRHRALQAQQQAIVKIPRVVDAIGVGDQRVEQGAQFQEPMPVGTVARQAGHLVAHDDADPAEADVGDQPLKAFTPGGVLAGLPLVLVNNRDLVFLPAQLKQLLRESPLVDRAFLVFQDLFRTGLPQVDHRLTLQVSGLDFGRTAHFPPPPQECERWPR